MKSVRLLAAIAILSSTAACGSVQREAPSDVAVDESTLGPPGAPSCLEGFGTCLDLRDNVDAPTGPSGAPLRFDCYGACGASCSMQNKATTQTTRCQSWSDQHRTLTYDIASGSTHPFCRWHDSCYLECAKRYDEVNDPTYACCTAYCDYGCEGPAAFNTSCNAGRYAPHWWERSVAGGIAFQRVCGNVDDYVGPTCRAGAVPNASAPDWSTANCLAWASTAAGIDPGAYAPSDGLVSFTKLADVGAWLPGACP